MRYLLESDSLSNLYDPEVPEHQAVARRLAALDDSDQIFLSILALYEFEYGFANAPEEKKPIIRQRVSQAQEDFPFLPAEHPIVGINHESVHIHPSPGAPRRSVGGG